MSFDVAIRHVGESVVVKPRGALDLATASDLRSMLEDVVAGYARVDIDLGAVTFADCAGLRPIRWA